jgi:chloride channel 3/4/5
VKKVEVLSAAVASGVTAAFGSPLGGVLFSLEVVSSYFPPKTMWRSFFCSIVTALVLLWLDPMQSGQLVEFSMTINQWQWFELAPFVLLGVLGGAMGALFIRFNVAATQFRRGNRWLRARPTLDVLILTFVTACLAFPNMFMRGNSGSLLAQLFADCNVSSVSSDDDYNQGSDSVMAALCENDNDPWGYIGLLVIAFIVRFLLTTVTYGASIPSGVFMPTLVTGALLGRVVGWLMWMWHRSVGDVGVFAICAGKSQCISPALYAVIGAASVLGGITRMTVSLAVILFEVTGAGGAETIVPIMVAVVCSKWSGDAFGAAGLYGRLIELNGLPHIDTHSEVDLPNPAAEMMAAEPVCLLTYGQTLRSIQNLLADVPFHGFPIIDNKRDRLVTGFIARADIEALIGTQAHALARTRASAHGWRTALARLCFAAHPTLRSCVRPFPLAFPVPLFALQTACRRWTSPAPTR